MTDAELGRKVRQLLAAHGAVALFAPVGEPESEAEAHALVVVGEFDTEGGSVFRGPDVEDALQVAAREARSA